MPVNIQEDWMHFRQIIAKLLRKDLSGKIESGSIFRLRPIDGKKIRITIPKIRIPYIWWGEENEGVGRGNGDKGKQIRKPCKGTGGGPGKGAGDGMLVDVDLEHLIRQIQEELELPDMKPKPNQTFEEIRTIYNGLAKVGPRALIHKRKMMLAMMKRLAAMGKLHDTKQLPGFNRPMPVLVPINDDRRFRQYNEIKVPSSNAVIFFMRDGSGSMDQQKCDIAGDIAFWLKLYINRFYDKIQVVYIWHDTEARELDEHQFFTLRDGGGTKVSSAFKLMNKIIKLRFPPEKWNIYGVYFGDGENFAEDNKSIVRILKGDLGPQVVNMMAQVEILHSKGYGDSLKEHLDSQISKGNLPHVRNTEVSAKDDASKKGWSYWVTLTEEERDAAIRKVLKEILGKRQPGESVRYGQANDTMAPV